MEGVCYGTEHILRTFRTNGYAVQEMVGAGGATKSRLWMQMHADVSNVPITLTEVADAPSLGSAILGAVAAGLFPDAATAAGQMVHARDRIEPNAAAHEQYRFFVDQYIATYGRVQDLIQETTRHVAKE
jgi:ribulose kinase